MNSRTVVVDVAIAEFINQLIIVTTDKTQVTKAKERTALTAEVNIP